MRLRYKRDNDSFHVALRDGDTVHTTAEIAPNIAVQYNLERQIVSIDIQNATTHIGEDVLRADKSTSYFWILASGDKFDVDAFLASSTLKPSWVWRRPDHSGVSFELGDSSTMSWYEQDDTAVLYMKEHREQLLELARFPGVESFSLGLEAVIQFAENHLGTVLGPSRDLMAHALELGLKLNFYFSFTRYDDER